MTDPVAPAQPADDPAIAKQDSGAAPEPVELEEAAPEKNPKEAAPEKAEKAAPEKAEEAAPVKAEEAAPEEKPEDAAPERKPVGKKLLGVLGALLIIAVVAVVTGRVGGMLAGDPTGDAKAGDCLAVTSDMGEKATEVTAELADCSAADAKYTVLGRVDGVKDVQQSAACDPSFDTGLKVGEEGYVIASEEGGGYLLCLKANG